ncbi:uncharacterized protein [Apostichopus japonicus]
MDTCYYSSEEDEWDELNQHLLSSENGLSQPLIPSDDGPNRPLTSIHKRRIPDKRYKESDHYVDISNNRISSIVWAAMKMSCIFHQRKLVVERQCFRCQIQHTSQSVQGDGQKSTWEEIEVLNKNLDVSGQGYYKDEDNCGPEKYRLQPFINGDSSSHSDSGHRELICPQCDSFWWNFHGKVNRYTDRDLGVEPWNHLGSWFLSLLGTFSAIAIILYDATYYLHGLWGEQSQIIHLISYATFMLNLVLYPLLNMICKIRAITQRQVPQLSWSTGLNERYLVKRLQYLDIPNRGVPGKLLLSFGLFCAVFHTVYRAKFYLDLCKRFSWHSGVSVICGGVIMVMFVTFQYMMYLTRLSFQRHFSLVVKFIEKNQGDLDNCRYILGSAFLDFNCFRKLIAIYMNLFIPVLTWAITTHVTWQYFVNEKSSKGHMSDKSKQYETCINILIWLEIILFLVVPIWSIGGLDTTYIWTRLRLRVLTIPRRASNVFWRKLSRHMDIVNEHYDRINFTMIFSIIGFFMALEFGNKQTTTFVIPEPYCDNVSEIVFGPGD